MIGAKSLLNHSFTVCPASRQVVSKISGSSSAAGNLASVVHANRLLSGTKETQHRQGVTAQAKNPFVQAKRAYYSTETTRVPDFSAYKKDATEDSSKGRAMTYVMYGSAGAITAMGAKNLVFDLLAQLTPAADVLALAKAEVDLTGIPEGKNVTIKWRGKPVFIRHRTQAEIDEANGVELNGLRDPQSDADRVKKPEFLVVLGICTHLGCVPIGEAGDYDGWYCPCHGSHYDISGRIRKGPAPLNLEVPPYEFSEDGGKLIVG